MGISKKEIVAAASKLLVETGKPPTNQQVRQHLGKGSMSTIVPVMREWRETQSLSATRVPLPDHLKQMIESTLEEFWAVCVDESSTELQISQAQIELLEEENMTLSGQLEAELEVIAELNEQLALVRTQHQEAETKLMVALEKIAFLEKELESVRLYRDSLQEKILSFSGSLPATGKSPRKR